MAFEIIYWGLLFWFDFRIQGFDILPDIIGYIMIFQGLKKLAEHHDYFRKAGTFALVLIFISIFDFLTFIDPFRAISEGFVGAGIGMAVMILNLCLVYHLCNGIAIMAKRFNNYLLAEISMRRWNFYLALTFIMIPLMLLAFFAPSLGMLVFVPAFIFSIIVLVLLMGLMKKAGDAFGD